MIVKVANEHVLLTGIRRLKTDNVEEFIKELRSINTNVALQVVNAELVAGFKHIIDIIHQSVEAKKRGILLSKNIEIDILLRLACTDQISKAVEDIGLKKGTNNVLIVAMGKINHLKTLSRNISKRYKLNDSIIRSKKLSRKIYSLHNIRKNELKAIVDNNDKLASILVERASILR